MIQITAPTHQRNGEILKSCDTIYRGSFEQDKQEISGISRFQILSPIA